MWPHLKLSMKYISTSWSKPSKWENSHVHFTFYIFTKRSNGFCQRFKWSNNGFIQPKSPVVFSKLENGPPFFFFCTSRSGILLIFRPSIMEVVSKQLSMNVWNHLKRPATRAVTHCQLFIDSVDRSRTVQPLRGGFLWLVYTGQGPFSIL